MKTFETILCIILFATLISCNDTAERHTLGLMGGDDYWASEEPSGDLSVGGGTSPYSYAWTTNGSSDELDNLNTGTYTVTLTDANGSTSHKEENIDIQTPEKVIKNGTINMKVEDYEASLASLKELITASKGYIGNESESRSSYRIGNHIVIRLPNAHFDKLMDQLSGLAFELHEKRASLTDVTEEYYDVEARLKAKRKVEQRYLDILQKADSVEDILKVEYQLKVIREEIESKEGRLKYLNNRVAQSTITLDIYQNIDFDPPIAQGEGFFGRMGDAISGGWNGMLNFMVGITYLWPFLLAITALMIAIVRTVRKRRINKLANV